METKPEESTCPHGYPIHLKNECPICRSLTEVENDDESEANRLIIDLEQARNVSRVFELNPELAKIGSAELYDDYLKTIFPESVVSGKILWHGNKEDFKDTGFRKDSKKGRTRIQFSEDGTFYGFYFGDYYSHYGSTQRNPERMSYPVVLDARKLRYIRPGVDKGLSSIDVTQSIKEQYDITDEDAIIEVGPEWQHESKLYSKNEAEEYREKIEAEFAKYLRKTGKDPNTFDVIDNPDDFQSGLDYIKEKGITSLGITEFVVFEESQIHILGSRDDIEKFKVYTQHQSVGFQQKIN